MLQAKISISHHAWNPCIHASQAKFQVAKSQCSKHVFSIRLASKVPEKCFLRCSRSSTKLVHGWITTSQKCDSPNVQADTRIDLTVESECLLYLAVVCLWRHFLSYSLIRLCELVNVYLMNQYHATIRYLQRPAQSVRMIPSMVLLQMPGSETLDGKYWYLPTCLCRNGDTHFYH